MDENKLFTDDVFTGYKSAAKYQWINCVTMIVIDIIVIATEVKNQESISE